MAKSEINSHTPIVGIHHIGIVAHDVPALARFHACAAGLQAWHALDAVGLPGEGVALAGPNAGLRLLAGGAPAQHRPVSEAGITHLCLQSPAIDALLAAFAGAGATFHAPPVDLGTGFIYSYPRDPEHNVTELEGVLRVWDEPQPWIAHVNIACADLGAQSVFYAALFGTQAALSPRFARNERLDRLAALPGVELCMGWVSAGNLQVELIRYTQPAAAATTACSTRRATGASGHAYIALEVDDLDAACAHLTSCGGALAHGAQPTGMATATDPEGNALWLLARAHLDRHGASITTLSQPDITARFAAAREQRQGTA